jgi:hypothetical protein
MAMGEVGANPARLRSRCIPRFLAIIFVLTGTRMWAAPEVKQTGPDLYAYISDNDSSSNSTFLVGSKGILVVDTGLDATEGGKLLQAIRRVSDLPVQYIVNTHYHPDHQGGNSTVGPSAIVISTDWTRERTLAVMQLAPANRSLFRPAAVTFQQKLTVHLDPYTAEILFSDKAHTSGDALVYFPINVPSRWETYFLTGPPRRWMTATRKIGSKALDAVLANRWTRWCRGTSNWAPKLTSAFRDYLHDLFSRVQTLSRKEHAGRGTRRASMESTATFAVPPIPGDFCR